MGAVPCCDKLQNSNAIFQERMGTQRWFAYFYNKGCYKMQIQFCPYCGQELSKLKDSKLRGSPQ